MSARCKKCVWLTLQTGVLFHGMALLRGTAWALLSVASASGPTLGPIEPSVAGSANQKHESAFPKEKTMKTLFGLFVLMVATLFSTGSAAPGISAQAPGGSGDVQVVEVTAKKYEFNPSPIHVKQGARVQLKITATDHAHGFKVSPFPEGGRPTDNPGLIFSSPQSCMRIEKHQTSTIEFVAKTAGTYAFKCCTYCGWHHRAMKGELIVEP